MTQTLATVILAAGQGTRMKSKLTKVLHPIGGKAMVAHAVDAAWALAKRAPVLVVGRQSEAVREYLGDRAIYVEQAEQLGTGHAVLVAADALKGQSDAVLVFYGDMPLLTPETLDALWEIHRTSELNPALTMLTIEVENPRGFGRIVRNADGTVAAIVEEAAATEQQKLIRELNPGVYIFDAAWLWDALPRITPTPPKNELYLTDVVELANQDGRKVLALLGDDPEEFIGINTRVHLAEAEAALRKRINRAHMLNGVTIIDPASTYIEMGVTIGQDTVILPNTILQGATTVGEGCMLGPNSVLRNATLGNGVTIYNSVIHESTVEDGADMGPFSRIRGGAVLGPGVHLGDFAEVKNSRFGRGVKMGHFSYMGDADIGDGVNIGAGAITANYDGVNKNRTVIGAGAFIGSDTMLVAPVKIGAGALTGAGAVVRDDVPEGKTVVGMPARIIGARKVPEKKPKT